METLPQEPDPQSQRLHLPRPHTWDCGECGQPSDVWEWGEPRTEDDDQDAPLDPVQCITCQVARVVPESREAYRSTLIDSQIYLRSRIGLPGGTLIISRENFGSRTPRIDGEFPGLRVGVTTETWNPSRPHDWVLVDEGLVFVTLGGFVFGGWDKSRDVPVGWMIYRPWAPPDDELYRREIYPADFYPSAEQNKYLNAAAAAFFALPDPRGRWRESNEYLKTAEDLQVGTFDVVCDLMKKNRTPAYRPTYGEIGRKIDTGYRKTKIGRWANPEESFPRLCTRRGFNPRELVDRAIAACASEE